MSNLLNSSHFVRNNAVLVVSGATPLSRTLEQLEATGVSGFVLETHGQLHGYIKGLELAKHVAHASADRPDQLALFSQQPIREIVASFPNAVVPASVIAPNEVVDESDLQNQADRVFAIMGPQGREGWYFNHETLGTTLRTKPVYICKRNHRNGTWNNGRCSVCPAAIIDATL